MQYLKTRPNDQQMNASLQFLLQAMQALCRKNPLTESFLVQLDLELESADIPRFQQMPYMPPTAKVSHIPKPIQDQSDTIRGHFYVNVIYIVRVFANAQVHSLLP